MKRRGTEQSQALSLPGPGPPLPATSLSCALGRQGSFLFYSLQLMLIKPKYSIAVKPRYIYAIRKN